ncbi:hypothetical protein [Desulfobacter curvatus]|uniref:hypothetical protein n=1 Tax=Desulfobacter curvatus TaxID=2290 RepID=UPI00036FE832|nr:hypothetical protein [Desulfobacter curvatus]
MNDLSFEAKKQDIQDYFEKIIMGYVFGDINTLLEKKFDLDEKETGGCTAPLAMSVFSAMNQLGHLTSPKTVDKIEINPDTELCIKEYCENWMIKVDEIYRKSTCQEILVSFFRHGLAHQFMPIHGMAITRHPTHKNLIDSYQIEGGVRYILQVKILAEHFLESISVLKKKIYELKETNSDFVDRFYRRLARQKIKYINKNKHLLGKAGRNISNNKEGIDTTTTSGTTTYIDKIKTTSTV